MPEKSSNLKYKNEDIFKAVLEVRAGAQLRPTARKYKIPRTTLRSKLYMKHPVLRKRGPSKILTSQEETLLKDWILDMAKKGFPTNKRMVADTVKCIIEGDGRANPFKENTPGSTWFCSFFRRNPDAAACYAKILHSSKSRVTDNYLPKWRTALRDYLVSENADDILNDSDRIITASVAVFSTSSAGLVLGPRETNDSYGIKQTKISISALSAFSASGKIFPPLIVYSRDANSDVIARHADEKWCIKTSSNGDMTSGALYSYIADTLIPLLKREVRFPVIFLIDSKKNHINQEVSRLCDENRIILYSLPPEVDKILRPADVGAFRPSKETWRKTVKKWKLQTGYESITTPLFAPLLEYMLNAVSPGNISSAFELSGLYPFVANAIEC